MPRDAASGVSIGGGKKVGDDLFDVGADVADLRKAGRVDCDEGHGESAR